jgi:hypothetical protein
MGYGGSRIGNHGRPQMRQGCRIDGTRLHVRSCTRSLARPRVHIRSISRSLAHTRNRCLDRLHKSGHLCGVPARDHPRAHTRSVACSLNPQAQLNGGAHVLPTCFGSVLVEGKRGGQYYETAQICHSVIYDCTWNGRATKTWKSGLPEGAPPTRSSQRFKSAILSSTTSNSNRVRTHTHWRLLPLLQSTTVLGNAPTLFGRQGCMTGHPTHFHRDPAVDARTFHPCRGGGTGQ